MPLDETAEKPVAERRSLRCPQTDGADAAEDQRWRAAAVDRIHQLTMPWWALGRLCDVMVELTVIQRTTNLAVEPAAAVVFAADHGATRRGVSPFPVEVTAQMVANFLSGGAAAAVLSRLHGLPFWVVDVGTVVPPAYRPTPGDRFLSERIAAGTGDFLDGPAMTPSQLDRALAVGASLLDRAAEEVGPLRTVIPGEMGIGNTTSAALVTALLLDVSTDAVIGRGAGVDDAGLARKRQVAATAKVKWSAAREPRDVLAAVGGFEIAAMTGLMLEAAKRRTVVLVDGVVATAAALAAVRIDPRAGEVMLATHRSPEPAHSLQLAALGLEPLLDGWEMRLGEASGALAAWPMVK
ncbi:MAG: nicotinate-nucleotide--dimethylbenzimidazole phosphoribosyltransferase, partial [Planctomycetia bacterium]